MSNCTPVIFSAVYAFFEEQGGAHSFRVLVHSYPLDEPGATYVEVRVHLGPGGEFVARVVYLVPDKDPSAYAVSVAYSTQDLPELGIGMSRSEARAFHAKVALVENMLDYVEEYVDA